MREVLKCDELLMVMKLVVNYIKSLGGLKGRTIKWCHRVKTESF
jgi:hypothetical protein